MFQPNPNFEHEMGNDPEFRRNLLTVGKHIEDAIAGYLPSGRSGGRRVAPFGKRSFAEVTGSGRDTAIAVGTKWRLGGIIEFGSVHNPAYAPVRKAAMASGLRFESKGK